MFKMHALQFRSCSKLQLKKDEYEDQSKKEEEDCLTKDKSVQILENL